MTEGPHCVVYPTPVLHTLGSYTGLLFNGACIILFTYSVHREKALVGLQCMTHIVYTGRRLWLAYNA